MTRSFQSGLLVLAFLFALDTNAQDYKRLMADPSVNFYDVCTAADSYFEERAKGKGSGWKGYQRWKADNEHRYYPSGDRSQEDPRFLLNTFERVKTEVDAVRLPQSSDGRSLFDDNWQDLGPYDVETITGHYSPGLGRIETFWVDPTDEQTIYLGSRSGGLWRSFDGGASWVSSNTDQLPATGVRSLTVNPDNTNEILISLSTANAQTSLGIYRSTDAGETWRETSFSPEESGLGGLGTNFYIHRLAYHPRVDGSIFFTTNRGVFRSTDHLETYEQITFSECSEIAFHPTDDDIIYTYENYYWGDNHDRILRSTDGGATFDVTDLIAGNNGDRSVRLKTSPVCADCLWFGSNEGLFLSTDSGVSFQLVSQSGLSAWAFNVSDTDSSHISLGYVDLHHSTNGGREFTQRSWWSLGSVPFDGGQYIHADIRATDCVNGNFYYATDGLLCRSTDNAETFEILSHGIGIRENYNVGLSQSNHHRTVVGSQDNGSSVDTEAGWLEAYGADGMEGIIHPLNDDWMIYSTQNGGRVRSRDGARTQSVISPPGQTAWWIAPMVYDPNDHMTVYSFGEDIHRSIDFGDNWEVVGSPTFSGTIKYASIAENDSRIMVCGQDSRLELSTDGGLTFTDISVGLPNWSITDVVFDPSDDQTMVVTYARYQDDGQKVYITHDSGANWLNITHNLSDMPVRCALISDTDQPMIYLGTEIGVYTMPMGGDEWASYSQGLANVTVREMEVMKGSNTLRASTWGRGLWEYALIDRQSYPAITQTEVQSAPTLNTPREGVDQRVYATVIYEGQLSQVDVHWSIGDRSFDQVTPMIQQADGRWMTQESLPTETTGDRIWFKVVAVGEGEEITETYKFMYDVRPFEYCAATGSDNTTVNFIDHVTFGTIDNESDKDGYGDFTTQVAEVQRGQVIDLMIALRHHWDPDTTGAWIDWNYNAEFEESEFITLTELDSEHRSFGQVTVPDDAVTDQPLRLRCRSNYWHSAPSDCGAQTGEVEDYTVIVIPNCQSSASQLSVSQCDAYTSAEGNVYTQSGEYTEILTTAEGCDSVVTLMVTIETATFSQLEVSSCTDYTSPSGEVWSQTDVYNDIIPNRAGCDSLIVVDLTILAALDETTEVSACGSYTAPSGVIYTESTEIIETITGANGCPAERIIDLTITQEGVETVTASSCESYTSPSGNVYTASGEYSEAIGTIGDCATERLIQLTIFSPEDFTLQETSCGAYTSVNGMTYMASGTYFEPFIDSNGCTAEMRLELEILPTEAQTVSSSACEVYVSDNGVSYTESGQYIETTTDANGCEVDLILDIEITGLTATVEMYGGLLVANEISEANYQWVDCSANGTPIVGATSAQYEPTSSGLYAVIISKGDCSITSDCLPMTVLSLGELDDDILSLYPNPTEGQTTLRLKTSIDNGVVEVYDLTGHVVYLQQTLSGTEEVHMDLGRLAAGQYFLRLTTDSGTTERRIVKW